MTKLFNLEKPKNSKRVSKWSDLPKATTPKTYIINNEGKTHRVTLSRHKRQVLEGLMINPIYAPSPARISDCKLHLVNAGIEIDTLMFSNDDNTEKFGIYVLKSAVKVEA